MPNKDQMESVKEQVSPQEVKEKGDKLLIRDEERGRGNISREIAKLICTRCHRRCPRSNKYSKSLVTIGWLSFAFHQVMLSLRLTWISSYLVKEHILLGVHFVFFNLERNTDVLR